MFRTYNISNGANIWFIIFVLHRTFFIWHLSVTCESVQLGCAACWQVKQTQEVKLAFSEQVVCLQGKQQLSAELLEDIRCVTRPGIWAAEVQIACFKAAFLNPIFVGPPRWSTFL